MNAFFRLFRYPVIKSNFSYLVADSTPNLDASSPADACRLDEYVSHMILLLSDDDDDDDDEENHKVFIEL